MVHLAYNLLKYVLLNSKDSGAWNCPLQLINPHTKTLKREMLCIYALCVNVARTLKNRGCNLRYWLQICCLYWWRPSKRKNINTLCLHFLTYCFPDSVDASRKLSRLWTKSGIFWPFYVPAHAHCSTSHANYFHFTLQHNISRTVKFKMFRLIQSVIDYFK